MMRQLVGWRAPPQAAAPPQADSPAHAPPWLGVRFFVSRIGAQPRLRLTARRTLGGVRVFFRIGAQNASEKSLGVLYHYYYYCMLLLLLLLLRLRLRLVLQLLLLPLRFRAASLLLLPLLMPLIAECMQDPLYILSRIAAIFSSGPGTHSYPVCLETCSASYEGAVGASSWSLAAGTCTVQLGIVAVPLFLLVRRITIKSRHMRQ